MVEKIKLYELPPSPNNIKVRIALNYKKIPFESVPIAFKGYPPSSEDRREVVKASGQPLTPALVHGDRAIFDSGAILRYLDANFPDTPRLFSNEYATMKEIEKWEWFARNDCSGPVSIIFGQAMSKNKDNKEIARAAGFFQEMTGKIEHQLERSPFLVGDRLTAADVTAVPLVNLATLSPEPGAPDSIQTFFANNFPIGDGRDHTRTWVKKVMEFA